MKDWRSQELANTAWAFAKSSWQDQPLLAAISKALLRKGGVMETRHAEMALLALSSLDDLEHVEEFLDGLQVRGERISGLALAGPLSACERRGLRGSPLELRLLSLLALCPDLSAPARNVVAARLTESGAQGQAVDNLRQSLLIPAGFNALTLHLLAGCGGSFPQLPASKPLPKIKPGVLLVRGGSRPQ